MGLGSGVPIPSVRSGWAPGPAWVLGPRDRSDIETEMLVRVEIESVEPRPTLVIIRVARLAEGSPWPNHAAKNWVRRPRSRGVRSSLLDLRVSSLRGGHANLLCIVPILTDDPRRESHSQEDLR